MYRVLLKNPNLTRTIKKKKSDSNRRFAEAASPPTLIGTCAMDLGMEDQRYFRDVVRRTRTRAKPKPTSLIQTTDRA